MPELTTTTADVTQAVDELACYLLADPIDVSIAVTAFQHDSQHYSYRLALGELQLLKIVLYLPEESTIEAIETARRSAVKAAMIWQKCPLMTDKVACYFVLVLDIRLQETANSISISCDSGKKTIKRLAHNFGARYFMEELITDISEAEHILQLFSWESWQSILSILKTPCELWRLLSYHIEQLQYSFASGTPSFDSEQKLLKNFINSAHLFTQALAVDKALVNYGMQDRPNSALMTMSLAQKNHSLTAQMYRQHMQQAAILWSQLSIQMIELNYKTQDTAESASLAELSSKQWQQQLLDESLFSRHELVRTIYKHPKQSAVMIEKGYVVHQHSYESLGRHYVLIFYGQDVDAQQSRAAIQPNLATIAQDVATRLSLVELHHIIVFGIAFIADDTDTFIDIDLWIQPITAMTPKERQLTKKLQHLNKQHRDSQQDQQPIQAKTKDKLPSLKLNLKIPAQNNKY